jgi:hypothetical protein
MAQVVNELSSLSQFISAGFKYNLETLPDTITAASFLFAILFQSPPLAALTGSIVVLALTRPLVGRFASRFIGDSAIASSEASRCSGHFPGVSFERILDLTYTKGFGNLEFDGLPTYYSMFLGFLATYVGALPLLYKKEIKYSPKRSASTTTGLVVLGLIVVIGCLYRVLSQCETPTSLIIGLIAGGVVGAVCVFLLALISERRLTNILSFPLIRNRAADGKPIYVCEKTKKPARK